MHLFRVAVLLIPIHNEPHPTIMDVLLSVIMNMIEMERKGEIIDRTLIRGCVQMFESLYESLTEDENTKIYLTLFEPEFLQQSREFYVREGLSLITTADAATFCRHAIRRLQEEEERCQQTLTRLTDSKIKEVVDQQLIGQNIKEVVQMPDSGVKHMLDNERIDDLQNVYILVARVDAKKEALRKEIQKCIVDIGTSINASTGNTLSSTIPPPQPVLDAKGSKKTAEKPLNQQTAAAIRWVQDVLQLKSKYYSIWARAFQKDQIIEKSLEVSFQDFVNANMRSPEHLSLFLDEHLKKGIKGKTEDEIDALLDNGITLLQYIADKDLFETYYKKHLSRRLLMKRSSSMDLERSMISKMKMKVGNTFTQRLEAMFRDMTVSDDLTSAYRSYLSNLGGRNPDVCDLEICVLTSTMWPIESMVRASDSGASRPVCNFPPVVEQVKKGFEKFYLGKHSGRALSWHGNMGTADIRLYYKKADGRTMKHELNVSTYGMVILLLFNDLAEDEKLSFEEIQARTNIPDHDLIRNLQSLAVNPKTLVLKKEPMSKDVNPSDCFAFNRDFKSDYFKVKVNVIASTGNKIENLEERRETERKANEERGGAIEAAIVRIMKYDFCVSMRGAQLLMCLRQRKHLTHQRLMTEVIGQLSSRFSPDVGMVKSRIESLIEREYLERAEDASMQAYNYLA